LQMAETQDDNAIIRSLRQWVREQLPSPESTEQ